MKRRFVQHTFLLVVCSALSMGAVGQATDVPLDRWVRHMQSALPPLFCAEGTPIRLCFSLTTQECEKGMYAMTRTCIANMRDELPAEIRMPEQGRQFGGRLGECATDAYAAVNHAKYVASEACLAARHQAQKAESTQK